ENAASAFRDRLSGTPFFLRLMETRLDLFACGRRAAERGRNGEVLFEQREMPVMHFQFRSIFIVPVSLCVQIPNAYALFESLSAHRARIHAQRATDGAGNSFHPFQSA